MEETAKRIQEQVGQVQAAYGEGRKAVSQLASTASEQSKKALALTDEWVHENPWMALGIVAGAGLLLGLVVAQTMSEGD